MQHLLRLSLALLFLAPAVLRADTIVVGNSLGNTQSIDSCGSCGYIIGQAFTTSGYAVGSYTFNAGAIGGQISPVLYTGFFNSNGTETFTVTAIGTTRTVTTLGVQTDAFGLLSGSALTGANTYFGFQNQNGGVVTFNYVNPTPNGGTYLVANTPGLGGTVTLEDTTYNMDAQNSLDNRSYALTATATSPVPEPATVSLVALGGIVGAFGLRRRLKR